MSVDGESMGKHNIVTVHLRTYDDLRVYCNSFLHFLILLQGTCNLTLAGIESERHIAPKASVDEPAPEASTLACKMFMLQVTCFSYRCKGTTTGYD